MLGILYLRGIQGWSPEFIYKSSFLILLNQLTRQDNQTNGIIKSSSTEGTKLQFPYEGLYVFKNIIQLNVVGVGLKDHTVQALQWTKDGDNTLWAYFPKFICIYSHL